MIYIVTMLGLVAMFFAYLPKTTYRYGLETAWIIIFVFLAIRYDFGNDYMVYLNGFNYFNSFMNFTIDYDSHFEPGWQILCYIFKPYGFFAMVAVITAIECFILYRAIKEYVPQRYYWFSIFLFVFSPDNMLVGASMMRNELVICMFVYGIKYIINRNYIKYIILVLLAKQIHSSAIILLPIYLFTYLKEINWTKTMSLCVVAICFMLFLFQQKLSPYIETFSKYLGTTDEYERYINEAADGRMSIGLGSTMILWIFVYIAMTINSRSKNDRLLYFILLLGTFVSPFAATMGQIGRLRYYFMFFAIFCYPIVWGGSTAETKLGWSYSNIFKKNEYLKLITIVFVFVLTIYSYLFFFVDPTWIKKYSIYKTIIFQ